MNEFDSFLASRIPQPTPTADVAWVRPSLSAWFGEFRASLHDCAEVLRSRVAPAIELHHERLTPQLKIRNDNPILLKRVTTGSVRGWKLGFHWALDVEGHLWEHSSINLISNKDVKDWRPTSPRGGALRKSFETYVPLDFEAMIEGFARTMQPHRGYGWTFERYGQVIDLAASPGFTEVSIHGSVTTYAFRNRDHNLTALDERTFSSGQAVLGLQVPDRQAILKDEIFQLAAAVAEEKR